jgi:hypothetical protein
VKDDKKDDKKDDDKKDNDPSNKTPDPTKPKSPEKKCPAPLSQTNQNATMPYVVVFKAFVLSVSIPGVLAGRNAQSLATNPCALMHSAKATVTRNVLSKIKDAHVWSVPRRLVCHGATNAVVPIRESAKE